MNKRKSTKKPIKEEEGYEFKPKTAEEYSTIKNMDLKYWIITNAFYLIVFVILVFIAMGFYIFQSNPENKEIITHTITNITQIITIIVQSVGGA